MNITELGGHSGCKILLCETDNNVFVRKVSGSIEYNDRLCSQEIKQEKWKNEVIGTPKIYGTGYTDDGLFYFDMEYIHGITLAEYMKSVDVSRIRSLADSLFTNVVSMDGGDSTADEDPFLRKISELDGKLSGLEHPVLTQGIRMLKEHTWDKFVKTPCHGDLTLENIMLKDNRIYVIDFLDSFYDSWLIDVGCLMQDLQIFWAYRKQERIDNNTIIRLIVLRNILTDKIREAAGEEYLCETYYALLLKLLRVYPYAEDEKNKLFLEDKVSDVIDMINEVSR